MACRLVPLVKNVTGVRPIGVGEVIRRIMAKAVGRVLKNDMIQATGSLQTCSGVDSGIEAVIHAMAKIFKESSTEAMLLVDADNAFNNLNRKTALQNIKALCPPLHTFLNNTYKAPSRLYISHSEEVLLSQEGTTQGDPDAMPMYAISTRPLIDRLEKDCGSYNVKQGWYADDSAAAGTLSGIKVWFDILCEMGPSYGYFPNSSKSILIVKDEECAVRAKSIFKDFPSLKITKEGERHLGAVVGSEEFRKKYIEEKVRAWVNDVKQLAEIGAEEPQIALSAYTKGLCRRWAFTQRTISDIGHLFQPLEDCITNIFIPAIVGRPISPLERQILALPVRYGGLGIQDPTQTSQAEYEASEKITEELVSLIYQQNNDLANLDYFKIKKVKAEAKAEKEKRFTEEYGSIVSCLDPLTKRSIEAAKEKGASAWLTALPLKRMGYILNKQEFRDAICLRYNWYIHDIPKYCGCGSKNDIVHTLSCKKGGYASMRHNWLRDATANIMREVCIDVKTEPQLLPVNPNDYNNRTNIVEGARLDISACGLNSTFERTFFDIRVSHPHAASNVVLSLPALYKKNEKEKMDLYSERVKETEKGSFSPWYS